MNNFGWKIHVVKTHTVINMALGVTLVTLLLIIDCKFGQKVDSTMIRDLNSTIVNHPLLSSR